jgi:hypothetical protein
MPVRRQRGPCGVRLGDWGGRRLRACVVGVRGSAWASRTDPGLATDHRPQAPVHVFVLP